MDVVDVEDAGRLGLEGDSHVVDVESARRRLQQHVRGRFQHAPGAARENRRHDERERGVGEPPVEPQGRERGGDGGGGSEDVAEDVQGGGADIEIAAAAQHPPRGDVDGEADGRDREHRQWHDGLRRAQPGGRLDEDPAARGEEDEGVDERGEHLETVVSIGEAVVAGAAREAQRAPRQAEGGGVQDHVPGVGGQRERIADPGARDLHEREDGDEQERARQRGFAVGR